ncbi:MAG: site-2 protease family protein [Leptospiraceae bacterium]|nr:site-2 protease family protein [Leptospiraceae bacterium]MCP5513570.1 site-2 protease family protein [Leptospiraceae bacterium]
MKSTLSVHIFLFGATFLTLTLKERTLELIGVSVQFLYALLFNDVSSESITLVGNYYSEILAHFNTEVYYSIPLLLILLAHEMGHYLPARYYGIRATLPFFIPMPIGPIGTMGAVIRIEEPIPDKKKLFDIGVGGPLMSFLLSIPCWIIGVYYSDVINVKDYMDSVPMDRSLVFGDSLFTYWSVQLLHGPMDMKTHNLLIHPLAQAGWVGFFVTAINLFPFGQLDGGHVIYSLFGEKYREWIYYLFLCFLFLGLVNFNWVIWGFIIYFLIKIEHPYVPDSFDGLDRIRKSLGFFMLFALLFIFVPIPMTTLSEMNQPTLLEDIFRVFL